MRELNLLWGILVVAGFLLLAIEKLSGTSRPLFCLFHTSSSSIINLLDGYLPLPQETPKISRSSVGFTG